MTVNRYLEKFTSLDGVSTFTFPLFSYKYAPSQLVSVPYKTVAGANYGYAIRGNTVGVKQVASESANLTFVGDTFTDLDTNADSIKKILYESALGWLYTLGADGTRRRARAQITKMPTMPVDYQASVSLPADVEWVRFSDWQSDQQTTVGPITLASGSVNFDVDSGGNAPNYDAVFLLKGTFTDPQIVSLMNSMVIGSTRDGSAAAHWLRIDCGRNRVEFSSNSGVSYIPDFTNYVRLPGQIALMRLEAGVNHMHYAQASGTPSATLTVFLYPHWH